MKAHPLVLQFFQQIFFARFAQRADQIGIVIEMILDRAFAPPGDKQRAFDAAQMQFFDDLLHNRLFADRQHLLRLRFCGWKQTSAQTGHRDDSVTN
jgi:hypothetical protein